MTKSNPRQCESCVRPVLSPVLTASAACAIFQILDQNLFSDPFSESLHARVLLEGERKEHEGEGDASAPRGHGGGEGEKREEEGLFSLE